MTWKIINIFAICESLLCSINVYCSHILFKWNPSLWLYNHFTYLWKLSTNTQNFTLDLWQVSYEINHHQWLIAHQAFIIFQIFTSFHDFCLFSEVGEVVFRTFIYFSKVEEKFLHFFSADLFVQYLTSRMNVETNQCIWLELNFVCLILIVKFSVMERNCTMAWIILSFRHLSPCSSSHAVC